MKTHRIVTVVVVFSCAAALAQEDEHFVVLGRAVARQAAQRARISAAQALEFAGRESKESAFVGVELAMEGNTPMFEVAFATPAGEKEVELDAVSGKPLSIEPPPAPRPDKVRATWRQAEALRRAKIGLAQAIETARGLSRGATTIAATFEEKDGQWQFVVDQMVGRGYQTVLIGPEGNVRKTSASVEDPGGRAWTFDDDTTGALPAGWTTGYTHPEKGDAKWAAEVDAKPMSGPHVLKLAARSGAPVFNVAMAKGTSYGDVEIRARLRADSGKEDQGGGVIWRCKDANNYYICRMNPLEGNFRVYHVVAGKRVMLASAKVKRETGKWFIVRAKMVGDHIMCFLDGHKMLDVHDKTIPTAGMIGLWTKSDASSSFDNIAVRQGIASKADEGTVTKTASDKTSSGGRDDDDND